MARFSSISWSLTLTHDHLARCLRDGDVAIDATAGKGNDCLFLAERVGPKGRVYAFDIQKRALDLTRRRLAEAGFLDRARLIEASHADLRDHVAEPARAIAFNLGYLPGGDHKLVTAPASTLAGLEASAELLAPGGGIAIVAYRGHPEGAAELTAVEAWCAGLDPARFYAVKREALNHPASPAVFLIEAAEKIS